MIITVELIGFGDDRPPTFGDKNRLELDLTAGETLDNALIQAGLTDRTGLSVLINGQLAGGKDPSDFTLEPSDALTVLHAMEGGATA